MLLSDEQFRGITSDRPKPFLQHLEDLRWTILWSLAVLAASALVCLPLVPVIFRLLCAPLSSVTSDPGSFLRSLDITGAFSIALQITLGSALLLGAPAVVWLAARFVFPGLTGRERRAARMACLAGFCLFFMGAALGYFLTLPIALKIFFSIHAWLGIRAEWTATSYMAFCLRLLLLFGLAFQLPVIIVGLGYCGVVNSAQLKSKRRHAAVAILVLAALLTPGPDMFSQVIMALPMYVLYEACIWIVRIAERRAPARDGGEIND